MFQLMQNMLGKVWQTLKHFGDLNLDNHHHGSGGLWYFSIYEAAPHPSNEFILNDKKASLARFSMRLHNHVTFHKRGNWR